MKFKNLLILIILIGIVLSSFSATPKRVILFMIDGLHTEAPSKLNMSVFNSLIKEGTYIEKSYMLLPHHTTVGDYSEYNSCSFPNPVLHEGTVFLRPENRYLQEVFSPARQTVFVVNTAAYRSISRGFTTSVMDPSLTDKQVVEQAKNLLKEQDPVFMRVHLQTPGDNGSSLFFSATPDKPYYRDIFGKDSPYVEAVEEADRLLGQFISFLKEQGKWESTVLIVTSDHGQSKIGWHPLFDEDSWTTPLVFVGPGIAKGRVLPYFEHTDLALTIVMLLDCKAPNNDGGSGNAVEAIMQDQDSRQYHPVEYVKTLNQQIKEFNILRARMIIASQTDIYFSNRIAALENENLTPEPFYHQDRITDWYKAGSIEHLTEANEKILQQMRKELDK